jgi:benzoyl-CoA reductase/2-hydroxyglutaryl-CoA dehydratase subunit BcrC/BadD/HgdB
MPTLSAVERLRNCYQARPERALVQPLPVAGITSNTAPWELLKAAGYFPVLLSPPRGKTQYADIYMEDVFDAHIRGVFDCLLSGKWEFIDLVVIPRTSEQEHKLFLYLREVARKEPGRKLPKVLLYNLPHARSPEARAYGLDRTQELMEALPPISRDRLRDAIAESNKARAAVRSLLQLRSDRLTGAEALQLIGAFYFMDRREYAALASAAAEELSHRPLIPGPRVMVKGTPLDHPFLHQAIEAHDAIVVAEDDWWGSRAAGEDIRADGDLRQAIFEKYYLDAPSPRVFPSAAADEWFCQTASTVDGVVFYFPPEDDVFGWDYPRQRRILDQRGIPHLLLRTDASAGDLSAEWHDKIEEFMVRLKR